MSKQPELLQSYLTFRLGDEIFAANVSKVLEILEIPRITKVPHAPIYMRGVINLRGNVMPVINARSKFGLPDCEDTISSCIIVLDIEFENQSIILGAVVDAVHEVMEINPEDIQPAPSIGTKYKSEFIQGMVKANDQFIMVLDLDLVFSSNEASIIKDIITEAEQDTVQQH